MSCEFYKRTLRNNAGVLLNACVDVDLAVNLGEETKQDVIKACGKRAYQCT